jgi:signal peptidase I
MKKVLYTILIVIIVLIALLLISSRFPMMKHQVMVVQSGSMEPAIKTGSIVLVTPVKKYNVNDIITFKSTSVNEGSVTHRITDMEVIEGNIFYITKGDSNEDIDTKRVPETEIIGRTIFWVPYMGYVVDFARKPIGLLVIILVPGLIIIADEGKKIWKEVQKYKNNKETKE